MSSFSSRICKCLFLFWSTHPITLPTSPAEHKMSLLNIWYPLTALCFSSMGSLCISTIHIFYSWLTILIYLLCSWWYKFNFCNKHSLLCTIWQFCPLSYTHFCKLFLFVQPLVSFYPRRKWVKCLQICSYFPTGLCTDLSWWKYKEQNGNFKPPLAIQWDSVMYMTIKHVDKARWSVHYGLTSFDQYILSFLGFSSY